VTPATFQLFARAYGPREVEPEIWPMRQTLPSRARRTWRLIALLSGLLALGLFGALYAGGDARTATTTATATLGPGWSCKPNILGTVCVRDVTVTTAKR
jgi:hypothetical protein